MKDIRTRKQYLLYLLAMSLGAAIAFFDLVSNPQRDKNISAWIFGTAMVLTYASLPLNLVELGLIRQSFRRFRDDKNSRGFIWVAFILIAAILNGIALFLRYRTNSDHEWTGTFSTFIQCMIMAMICMQAGMFGVDIPKVENKRASDNLAGAFSFTILAGVVWFIYGAVKGHFYWPDLAVSILGLGWSTMFAASTETPGTAVTDATTIVEGASSVAEAKEILGSRGVSVAQQEAAIGEVKKRQIASRIAMDHLISLGLANPRDVIRCENAVRIQFGILNRKKIPIGPTLAKQVGKWVMLQDYAPTLSRWISDEGAVAMKELEGGDKERVMEFLKLRFPDCVQREDVALLLASSPKIGDRLHMLLYLHDEHQKPKAPEAVRV